MMHNQTKSCFRDKNRHEQKIKITSPEYDKALKKTGSSLVFPVHSDLSVFNVAPLQYIWPKWNLVNGAIGLKIDSAELYNIYVNSCRYFSNKEHATVLVKVYPDIKWNLGLSFNFTNPASYTHGNLPGYSRTDPKNKKVAKIIREERKAQSKAVATGKESERMKNSPGMLTKFELKLEAKWNDGSQVFELGTKFAEKIRKVLNVFIKYKEIADKVKETLGGNVKAMPGKLPFMLEVQSPSLNANIDWYLEKGKDNYFTQVATVGKLNFKADPLMGAEFTIDLLALGSRMHPLVAAMIAGLEIGLSALNGGITFETKFYGKFEFNFNAL